MFSFKPYLHLIIFSSIFISGCAEPPAFPDIKTSAEAEGYFKKLIKEEFNYTVVMKTAGETLYIYFPTEEAIIDEKKIPPNSFPKHADFNISQLDSSFTDKNFSIGYNIAGTPESDKEKKSSPGYITEEFRKINMRLQIFFARAFLDLRKPPRFVVFAIADIKKGHEFVTTFYFDDFRKYFYGGLPISEYMHRELRNTIANDKIINDTQGMHILYKDITLGGFLARQIKNRVMFKYQNSEFRPSDDFESEILKIIKTTLSYYPFEEFGRVELKNLQENSSRLIGKERLKEVQ